MQMSVEEFTRIFLRGRSRTELERTLEGLKDEIRHLEDERMHPRIAAEKMIEMDKKCLAAAEEELSKARTEVNQSFRAASRQKEYRTGRQEEET